MPKSARKELGKMKKIIHPKSRKSLKLTGLVKKIANREKSKLVHHVKQNLLGEKVLWFKNHLTPDIHKCSPALALELIDQYLKRFNDELEEIKFKHSVGNRKQKQHANREGIIKLTILHEKEEFATCGLEVPDILNHTQLRKLQKWNGELRYLQNFKFQRYNMRNLENSIKAGVLEQSNHSEQSDDSDESDNSDQSDDLDQE